MASANEGPTEKVTIELSREVLARTRAYAAAHQSDLGKILERAAIDFVTKGEADPGQSAGARVLADVDAFLKDRRPDEVATHFTKDELHEDDA